MRPGNAKVIQEPRNVETHLAPVLLRIVRFATQTVTAGVNGDHTMIAREILKDAPVRPAPGAATSAMQEHDRLADSLLDVVDADAGGIKVTVFLGKSSRGRRPRYGNDADNRESD